MFAAAFRSAVSELDDQGGRVVRYVLFVYKHRRDFYAPPTLSFAVRPPPRGSGSPPGHNIVATTTLTTTIKYRHLVIFVCVGCARPSCIVRIALSRAQICNDVRIVLVRLPSRNEIYDHRRGTQCHRGNRNETTIARFVASRR